MKSFAYIVNPVTIEQVKEFWGIAKALPGFILKPSLSKVGPFKVRHIRRIKSAQAHAVSVFLILLPLLQELRTLEEELIIDKIISASRIAQNLGAKILGLSGYLSLIQDKRNLLAKNLKIPMTSGNSYASWSVFEAIYRMSRARGLDLKQARVAVIGAANSIGNLCARKLSGAAGSITIFDKEEEELEATREEMLQLNPLEVIISPDADSAVKAADIVVNASLSSPEPFRSEVLKPNAVVCDISLFAGCSQLVKSRPDVTVIQCGLIRLPAGQGLGINSRLPKGIIPASFAEAVLLTLEEKFTNYSLLGEGLNLDKLEDIADLGARCGFEVWVPEAPLQ